MSVDSSAPFPLDVLVPAFERPAALAVTLAGLSNQTFQEFRVVVSDQSERLPANASGEVVAVGKALEESGRPLKVMRHLPRRGIAENRAFLLAHSSAPYVLFLDDDLLLERSVLARMMAAIRAEGCGFVGCAPVGLSYADEERPEEHEFEPWVGGVRPEKVRPAGREWRRHAMHNAANVLHVQKKPEIKRHLRFAEGESYVPYHIAWVGGCVLYDAAKLRAVGGFEFWKELPEQHAGEDVVAQLRVMGRFGGCGLLPSGVTHLELPTTVANREVDAPHVIPLGPV